MSIAIVNCRAQIGLYAPLVHVEVSIGTGLPTFNIVGLPATVVRESKDRVRAALIHSNFEFPAGRITVNLSPADIPKHGGRFDLPIALGILLASGQVHPAPERARRSHADLQEMEFYGELGLSGELKAVPGTLLVAAEAARQSHEVIVPGANAEEVRVLLAARSSSEAIHDPAGSKNLLRARPTMRAANHLLAVCAHVDQSAPLPALTGPTAPEFSSLPEPVLDLNDVRGQVQAKRALTVAAAGSHSILMMGPPGAGKSMLALRLPGLLPPLTDAESLEVAAIASASGLGFNPRQFGRRPVRMPHHTASPIAMVGGGSRAKPGEISLAHHGVLFLDELLEYDRRALEALREPLETGIVSIARAAYHAQYPAEFQLVAAMNPCPCGRFGDPLGDCHCTPAQIAQYRGRISAPLMERFDLHLDIPRVAVSDFDSSELPQEGSRVIADRVARAREIQLGRQGRSNARLIDGQIQQVCALEPAAKAILDRAVQAFGFSARARQRVLKVSRTIADLESAQIITAIHVSEAVTYRTFDRRLQGPVPGMMAPSIGASPVTPWLRTD